MVGASPKLLCIRHDLPIVSRVETREREVMIHVRAPRTCARCPRSGESSRRVHQKHVRRIRHTTLGDRTVFLSLSVRRFVCRLCGKPFSEAPPPLVSR
jgi:transposase